MTSLAGLDEPVRRYLEHALRAVAAALGERGTRGLRLHPVRRPHRGGAALRGPFRPAQLRGVGLVVRHPAVPPVLRCADPRRAAAARVRMRVSASVLYLGAGAVGVAAVPCWACRRSTPKATTLLLERLSELALIVAVFSAGLTIERHVQRRSLVSIAVLLLVVMPLTILAIARSGCGRWGCRWAPRSLLGAVLAPTDPVLAGDVGLSEPGGEVVRRAAPVAAHRGRVQRRARFAVRGARPVRRPGRRNRLDRPMVRRGPPLRRRRRARARSGRGYVAAAGLTGPTPRPGRRPRRRASQRSALALMHLRRRRGARRLRPARGVRRRLHVPPLRVRPRDPRRRPPRHRDRRQGARARSSC